MVPPLGSVLHLPCTAWSARRRTWAQRGRRRSSPTPRPPRREPACRLPRGEATWPFMRNCQKSPCPCCWHLESSRGGRRLPDAPLLPDAEDKEDRSQHKHARAKNRLEHDKRVHKADHVGETRPNEELTRRGLLLFFGHNFWILPSGINKTVWLQMQNLGWRRGGVPLGRMAISVPSNSLPTRETRTLIQTLPTLPASSPSPHLSQNFGGRKFEPVPWGRS